MSTVPTRNVPGVPTDDALRRRLVLLAGVSAVLAILHFVDHVVRGEQVVNRGLDPEWNHSGWPFTDATDKPYLFPIYFVVVNGLLLGGILLTRRGKLWAGFWLGTSTLLVALVLFVHFISTPRTVAETPSVIAMSHDTGAGSALALIDLAGLVAVLALLGYQSVVTRRSSGRW